MKKVRSVPSPSYVTNHPRLTSNFDPPPSGRLDIRTFLPGLASLKCWAIRKYCCALIGPN